MTSAFGKDKSGLTFRASICPFSDFGSIRKQSVRHQLPETADLSGIFYCDETLFVPDATMATTNLTSDRDGHPDTHSSSSGKSGSGVSVVAVAVLGTFGLLILLVLLIMVLVHFWR